MAMGLWRWLRRTRRPAVDPAAGLTETRRVEVSPEHALLLHGPAMHAWLRRLLDDPDDAEDAYREACLRVLRFADRQREPGPEALRAWVFRIARREGYRALKKRSEARRRAVRLETDDADAIPAAGPGLSTALREGQLEAQRTQRLQALLSELSPPDAALLTLRFREGLSHKQIGARLAEGQTPIAEATIRKRLSRAIAKLRARAEAQGLEELLTR